MQMPVSIRPSFTSRAIGFFRIRCVRRGRWGRKPTAIRPLLAANSALMAKNEQITTDYLARLLRGDLVNSVYSQILAAGGVHEVSVNKVADNLNMSTRILQRKLKTCGTSFESLVAEVFRERALQYMENPNFSIQEVGRIMGFKDLSNFSRAFKRWTSISPTEYRNMART